MLFVTAPSLSSQSDGKTFNRLICFTAWLSRDKSGHSKARAFCQSAQIGFAVPPAPLGAELEPLAQ